MARLNDLDPIEPEQVSNAVDLLLLCDKGSETDVDKKITVEDFHATAPNASASARGYVTTGAQTISGVKTFANGIITSDDATINGDLNVNGDIYQNGQSYETHAEKLYTKKDMIITRDGAESGLAQNALTGIKAKKYDGTNDGVLAFDSTGTARVGDEGSEEPLLTRSEASDLNNNDLLVWDSANQRAVHAPRPTHSNQALQSIVTNGAVSYQWGNAGSAGVAFKGTRTQYETAKLIPEGDTGFIPSGALVIITDENKTYVTDGTGSQQTLSLVSSIMRAETNSGITITDNQSIKADTVIFTGSRADWNMLTPTQKAKFNIVNITGEDTSADGITNAVTSGDMRAVTSNAVAGTLIDKVEHLYLSVINPSGSTTAEKLQTILNTRYSTNEYKANTSYVCSVEAGGHWFGFCTFSTMGEGANYATGIGFCNGEILKLVYSNGTWTVN